MQVSNPNNIKIYNLSQGKSLPEFIGEKKRRSLLKKDVELQRRIELIQDFEMPTVSNTIKMSNDEQYIFATGTYKPRVRCYDVKELSMKFERCIDCEVVTFCIVSDDYAKAVYLLQDRHLELHTPQGTHYKIRFPRFGRDMAYHPGNCDLMVVGAGCEINRLNLDQGRFLKSFETSSTELTKITLNKEHHLVMTGSVNGLVECWDPRSKSRAGILDCSLGLVNHRLDEKPRISALEFDQGLCLGVGTNTGHVLLYDIRSSHPYVIKDHFYEHPIHSIAFNKATETVISSDKRAVKLWNEHTGKAITAVEMKSSINDLYVVNGSGLFFLANESPKIHTYFIPMLGTAPKWCSFLDNLTEELEENPVQELYDDYKFVTAKELETIGLSNLVGSNLLRAYMHGYFIDMRLYEKAVSVTNPFAYKEYRKKKIAEKIAENHKSRVSIKKTPSVNKKLAERLMTLKTMSATNSKKKQQKKDAKSLLKDSRFQAIFENPDFEVDEESEEFLSVHRASKGSSEKDKAKSSKNKEADDISTLIEREEVSSSDEEKEEEKKWVKHSKKLKKDENEPKMFTIKSSALEKGNQFNTLHDLNKVALHARDAKKTKTFSMEDRLKKLSGKGLVESSSKKTSFKGESEITFDIDEKKNRDKEEQERKHKKERKMLRRPLSKEMKDKKRKTRFRR